MLGRSKDFVQRWCYLYRDHGIDAIVPRKQTGRPPTLRTDQHEAFKQRMHAGPVDGDGVCTLRGKDAMHILEQEFGVRYSLNGAQCETGCHSTEEDDATSHIRCAVN